jgi:hypothetical protein
MDKNSRAPVTPPPFLHYNPSSSPLSTPEPSSELVSDNNVLLDAENSVGAEREGWAFLDEDNKRGDEVEEDDYDEYGDAERQEEEEGKGELTRLPIESEVVVGGDYTPSDPFTCAHEQEQRRTVSEGGGGDVDEEGQEDWSSSDGGGSEDQDDDRQEAARRREESIAYGDFRLDFLRPRTLESDDPFQDPKEALLDPLAAEEDERSVLNIFSSFSSGFVLLITLVLLSRTEDELNQVQCEMSDLQSSMPELAKRYTLVDRLGEGQSGTHTHTILLLPPR